MSYFWLELVISPTWVKFIQHVIWIFFFLQISNLVPHPIQNFSPIWQLAQGDLIFAPPWCTHNY